MLKTILLWSTVLMAVLAVFSFSSSADEGGAQEPSVAGAPFAGTWYASLDAEPFGLPAGSALAALLVIHPDGSMIVADAGDFGAAPISLVQSPQLGSWQRTGLRSMQGRTLFFAGDPATLDATAIKRGLFSLEFAPRSLDHLVGVVEIVEQLECRAGQLPGFLSCPNPILTPDSEWLPEPGGVPNVGFQAWRLRTN